MKVKLAHSFAKALKQARIRASLSQKELAIKAQLNNTYISLLERGLRKPSLQCVMALSAAMDIDTLAFVDEILTYFNAANTSDYPEDHVVQVLEHGVKSSE